MPDPFTGIAVIAVSAAVFFYLLYLSVNYAVLDALRKARAEGLVGPAAETPTAAAPTSVPASGATDA